jgi:ABC-type oligopeptide transport system substrate-binding subunit
VDLSRRRISVLLIGLALSWSVGAQDKTKWTFKLRPA